MPGNNDDADDNNNRIWGYRQRVTVNRPDMIFKNNGNYAC
jgi:hypothetical protein